MLSGWHVLQRHALRMSLRPDQWLVRNLFGYAVVRYDDAVAALVPGDHAPSLSMMVAIAVMVGSFRQTVVRWLEMSLQADVFVSAPTRAGGFRGAAIDPEVAKYWRDNYDLRYILQRDWKTLGPKLGV